VWRNFVVVIYVSISVGHENLFVSAPSWGLLSVPQKGAAGLFCGSFEDTLIGRIPNISRTVLAILLRGISARKVCFLM